MDVQMLIVAGAVAVPFVLYGAYLLFERLRSDSEDTDYESSEEELLADVEHQYAKDEKRQAKLEKKLEHKETKQKAKLAKHTKRKRTIGHHATLRRSEPMLAGVGKLDSQLKPIEGLVATAETEEPVLETTQQLRVTNPAQAYADSAVAGTAAQMVRDNEAQDEEVISSAVHTMQQVKPQLHQQQSAPAEPPVSASTDTQTPAQDTFPAIPTDVLNEYFYYVARGSIPNGLDGTTALQMAAQLVSKSGLERYQMLLCHDSDKGDWEKPRPDKQYSYLLWAIPLCNRNSLLSNEERAMAVRVIQEHMRRLGGRAEFPPHQDIDERLQAVREFCDKVDLELCIFLLACAEDGGKPQRVGDIFALARHEKMEEVRGRLVRMVNGEVLYTLDGGDNKELGAKSPDRTIAKLKLRMDVPHVSIPEAAFDDMFALARKLGRVLGFNLVDENQGVVGQEEQKATREYILESCKFMEENGVRPGSKLARTLFT